jgi:protein phosphatase
MMIEQVLKISSNGVSVTRERDMSRHDVPPAYDSGNSSGQNQIRLIDIAMGSVVVLIGVTGAGKSRFAEKNFHPTEVVSSDHCRALIADDENDQRVTREAFELVHTIADKRLKYGRLVVADATNVEVSARRKFIEIARRHRVACVAIVFDLPAEVIALRRTTRGDRLVPEQAVARQRSLLSESLPGLHDEGFTHIHVFREVREIDGATVKVIASR